MATFEPQGTGFTRYKFPDGKSENEFTLYAEFKDRDFADDVIKSTQDC